MNWPPIVIVDENDHPIGQASMDEAQAKGLYHRIVRIMVEDGQGNVLLQKRGPNVLFPNRWDHSAAGHVDAGEDYSTAAARELAEELGLTDQTLKEIGYYKNSNRLENRQLNRFSKVYKVVADPKTELHLEASEVAAVRWFTIDEAKQLVQAHPHDVTDGLVQVLKRYY